MTNKEYMAECARSFRAFVANHYEQFRTDKGFMLRMLEYTAHNIGAGIRIDGTEHNAISGSYSTMLVTAFIGMATGIPIDAKTWSKWLWERVGMAYN